MIRIARTKSRPGAGPVPDQAVVFPFGHSPTGLMGIKGWIFLAGVLALGISLALWFSGSKQAGIFVGLWVPSLWVLASLVDKMETARQ